MLDEQEMLEHVVLVDEQDNVLGIEEKIKAHKLALLHRAFSVFIYRKVIHQDAYEILLQQRHRDKYHCGGLWTNTCCSHPRLDEEITNAGQRRLKEELSISVPLRVAGTFQYIAEFENGLTEHEYDYVLLGEYDPSQKIILNPVEVQDYRWITIHDLEKEISLNPVLFTPWFKTALNLAMEELCRNS